MSYWEWVSTTIWLISMFGAPMGGALTVGLYVDDSKKHAGKWILSAKVTAVLTAIVIFIKPALDGVK